MTTNHSATVDTENFANNAFSDFAPLLTLFGDEVTKQFLALSMGMADNILLGIAPIGVITIIVSAIRVGGHRFMKSVIGRARDSPDDEEKEILSSTSTNVREIWNGDRIVRQTGGSMTMLLVFDPDLIEDSLSGIDRFYQPSCLRRLHDRVEDSPGYDVLSRIFFRYIKLRHLGGELFTSEKVPPNLTINIDGAVPEQWTVFIFTSVGLLIQAAVMAINAVAVYHWHWLRAGKTVAPYGYPIWAVGTASLGVGTCICGWVVESSSWKFSLRPKSAGSGDTKPNIVLFQRRIPDLNIPAYAITPIRPGGVFKLSRRRWPLTPEHPKEYLKGEAVKREILTTLGALLAVCGFVCQNIGTRELHWSAGVLQLGATLILTLLRAWLRHHVGDPPQVQDDTAVTELEPGFEACDLATRLTKYHCYLQSTLVAKVDYHTVQPEEIRELGSAVKPLDANFPTMIIPSKVAGLGLQEHSYDGVVNSILKTQALLADFDPDADEVVKMAVGCFGAMKEVMKIICKDRDDDGVRALRYFTSMMLVDRCGGDGLAEPNTFGRVPIRFAFKSLDPDHIRFIRAIISLTRYEYRDMIVRSAEGKLHATVFRILGHCKRGDVEAYVNLLNAWLGTEDVAAKVMEEAHSQDYRIPNIYPQSLKAIVFGLPFTYALQKSSISTEVYSREILGNEKQWIMETGVGSKYVPRFELVIEDMDRETRRTFKSVLERNITLDLFSSFMLEVALKYEADVMKFMGSDPDKGCNTLVDILMKHEVCRSQGEARLAIVPSLVARGILFRWPAGYNPPPPNTPPSEDNTVKWNNREVFFEWPRRASRPWSEGGRALGEEEDPKTLVRDNILALELRDERKYKESEQMNRRVLAGWEKALGKDHPAVMTSTSNLAVVLQAQGKYEEAEQMHRRALEGREKALGKEDPDTLVSVKKLALVLQDLEKYKESEQLNRRALKGEEKEMKRVYGTALIKAIVRGDDQLFRELLDHGADVNETGAIYHTALQAAVTSGHDRFVDPLLKKGADVNIEGGQYGSVFNAAVATAAVVETKREGVLNLLLQAGAALDTRNQQGLTAIHYAGTSGDWCTIEFLLDNKAGPKAADEQGRNVLHYLVCKGSHETVQKVLEDERTLDLNVADKDGWTPLHWVCRGYNLYGTDIIGLLIQKGSDPLSETKDGWTPENIAIFHNAARLVDTLQISRPTKRRSGDGTRQSSGLEQKEPPRVIWEVGQEQQGYGCDDCRAVPIYGVRWHCKVCRSFDLCFKCHWHHTDTHPGHEFEKFGTGPDRKPVFKVTREYEEYWGW